MRWTLQFLAPLVLAPLAALPLLGASAPDAPSQVPAAICHAAAPDGDEAPATAILTGYGSGGFKITTANPEAQAYFNNGMQLAHAFAHKAATKAFIRAERLDPGCAMCVWGEAWSRGPTINYGIDKTADADLAVLADKAAALSDTADVREKRLIAALQTRYRDADGPGPRDTAFAEAMDVLAREEPSDVEVADMAADAWLIAADRSDHRKIGRAVEILKAALRQSPDDTGLIHFYIHATEMYGAGVQALPYAQKLQALAPAASHLVHMPSHTYFWAGWYQRAEASNLDAVEIDKANALRLKPKDGVFGLTYHAHNVQFGEGAALLAGDAAGALRLAAAALRLTPAVKPDELYPQIQLGTAYVAFGRFASPAEIEALPPPGDKTPLLQALWSYARGESAARRGDADGVKAAEAAVRSRADAIKNFGAQTAQARAMASIAAWVLQGRAAMIERRWREAEEAFRRAAELQEAKLGDLSDPPAWWYPVRRSLAAALLAAGRPDAAQAQARASLRRWPYDPLSLKVLSESETAVGQVDAGERDRAFAKDHWSGDMSRLAMSLI